MLKRIYKAVSYLKIFKKKMTRIKASRKFHFFNKIKNYFDCVKFLFKILLLGSIFIIVYIRLL